MTCYCSYKLKSKVSLEGGNKAYCLLSTGTGPPGRAGTLGTSVLRFWNIYFKIIKVFSINFLNISHRHQLTDWRTRPLPLELLNYARNDTHYLLYLWRRMREDLRAFSPIALQTVFDMSQQVCLKVRITTLFLYVNMGIFWLSSRIHTYPLEKAETILHMLYALACWTCFPLKRFDLVVIRSCNIHVS